MIALDDVLQMDGTVFSIWLKENREKYGLDCERLGRYLGVETETVKGYEKGYFCRQVYREALFRYFEDAEWARQQPKSAKKDKRKMRVLQDALAAPLPEITFPAADPYVAADAGSAASAEPETEQAEMSEPEPASNAPEPSGKPDQETILSLAQEVLNQKGTSFGAWLKDCRKSLGMSQTEFGKALDYTQHSMSALENGYHKPPLRKQNLIRKQVAELWPATCGPQGNQNAPMTVLPQNSPNFGAWLKERREAIGMSQKELAAALGFKNRHAVSKLERGDWVPLSRYRQQLQDQVERLVREQPQRLPETTDAALSETPSVPPETPTEKEELKMPADFETRTDEPLPSAKGELQPAGDFMVTYDRINWLVFAGLYKLNDSGMLKVKEYLQDLLHNEENLESCFADADD